MKLGSKIIWFPVLHIRAAATYRLLPELTLLHRTLESAVKEFSRRRNVLAGVPIPDVFRHVFGISGAREILPGVIDDLIERGRIHRVSIDERDLSELRIIDLAPGRRERDWTPGAIVGEAERQVAQSRVIDRFFDPVLEEIVSADLVSTDPTVEHRSCVPPEPFLEHLPTHWVERELRLELQDDVQLYTATSELIGHRWRRCVAEVSLKEGELFVDCEELRQSEYLRGLRQRVRQSWLLSGSLNEFQKVSPGENSDMSIHCRLSSTFDGLVLTRGLPESVRSAIAFPSTAVVVALDPADGITEPTIVSNLAPAQTMQVAYPRNDHSGISGIFLAREGREYLKLPAIWDGLHAEIGVFRSAPGFQQDGTIWNDVVDALHTECRYSDNPETFVLLAFWLDPEDFWKMIVERSSSETDISTWVTNIVNALKKLPMPVLDKLEPGFFFAREMEFLRQRYTELENLFPSAQLQFENNVSQKNVIAIVPESCTRVVAFDTSSFIRFGSLVEYLRSTDFLVTPQVVAFEVERKKTENTEFRIISRRNLRAIDALPRERWTAPFHDYSLLAAGDKRNNDGAIIATLIPYRDLGLEVIVVSEDHDFLLRCKPYGIDWMNAENFLNSSQKINKGNMQ